MRSKDRVRTFRFNWWASNMLDEESKRRKVTCTKVIEDCLVKCLGTLYPNAPRIEQRVTTHTAKQTKRN